MEVALGGQWTNGTLSVAAGYEVSVWCSAMAESLNQVDTTRNLVLDGFFVKAGVDW